MTIPRIPKTLAGANYAVAYSADAPVETVASRVACVIAAHSEVMDRVAAASPKTARVFYLHAYGVRPYMPHYAAAMALDGPVLRGTDGQPWVIDGTLGVCDPSVAEWAMLLDDTLDAAHETSAFLDESLIDAPPGVPPPGVDVSHWPDRAIDLASTLHGVTVAPLILNGATHPRAADALAFADGAMAEDFALVAHSPETARAVGDKILALQIARPGKAILCGTFVNPPTPEAHAYALAWYLLLANATTYFSDQQGTASGLPIDDRATFKKLGAPQQTFRTLAQAETSPGVFTRRFAGGSVTVTPVTKTGEVKL